MASASPVYSSETSLEVINASRHLTLQTAIAFADLLVAAGVVATLGKEKEVAAKEVRRLARLKRPTNPNVVVDQLIAMCAMSAAGCVLMAFCSPPALLSSLSGTTAVSFALKIAWIGFFSIAFTFFAAIARAAVLSKRATG